MPRIGQHMWRNKQWLIFAGIVMVAVIAGVFIYGNKTKPAVAGATFTVERGNLVSHVSATGTVKPVNMVDISSKISGRVKKVQVSENDVVQEGQILLLLDDEKLKAQVAQAYARMNNAEANYKRSQRLNSIGAVPDQQLDAAYMEYVVTKANYDDAASQLEDTIIRSPIAGIVIGKPIPAGQTVAPGISNPMVLLTVADMSKMQVETQVDETDIGKITVGQAATFSVDAYPGKNFKGTVSNISQRANIQQNVVYYTVLIDVEGTNAASLKPTMTARVSINAGERKNVLVVPLAALKSNKGQQYVQMMRNEQPQNMPVVTGLIGEDRVEVVSGVNEGDQILLSQTKTAEPKAGGTSSSGRLPGMPRI